MKAKLTKTDHVGKIAQNRKTKHFARSYQVIDSALSVILDARIYESLSVTYCCVWLHADTDTSGGGRASGYGYHKESAALSDALQDAGVFLSERIDGHGDAAVGDALLAAARAAASPSSRKLKLFIGHA